MRQKDQDEIKNFGVQPNKALYRTFKAGLLRKTYLVGGEIAAMSGVCGDVLGTTGRPYLLTAPACEKVSPLVFVRVYKQQVEEMTRVFSVLENYVDATYEQAVRVLRMTGFTLTPSDVSSHPFYKFSMVCNGF